MLKTTETRQYDNFDQEHTQAVWETSIAVWAPKLWYPNNTFQVLFFQLYFNKKIC